MCGIRLEVWDNPNCPICQRVFVRNDDEDHDNNKDDNRKRRSLLRRRGPDAQGTVKIVDNDNEQCQSKSKDSSSTLSSLYHRIHLHASVLQMRQELQTQPVKLKVPRNSKTKMTAASITTITPLDNTISNDDNDDDNDAPDDDDNDQAIYLCWNGEVYEYSCPIAEDGPSPTASSSCTVKSSEQQEEVWQYDISDTRLVSNLISSQWWKTYEDDEDHPHDQSGRIRIQQHQQQVVLSSIMSSLYNAEFSFLVLSQDGVYFGRDKWGRRSLLQWNCPNCHSFIITSVTEEYEYEYETNDENEKEEKVSDNKHPTSTTTAASDMEWIEIVPGHVHYIGFLDFKQRQQQSNNNNNGDDDNLASLSTTIESLPFPPIQFKPPPRPISQHQQGQELTKPDVDVSITTSIPPSLTAISDEVWTASLELEFHLRRAISMRLDHHSTTMSMSSSTSNGVLFSGGVDSVVIAALAADILSTSSSSPPSSSSSPQKKVPQLHLYNVSFGPDRTKSADRQAALISYEAIRSKYSNNSDDRRPLVDVVFHDIAIDDWDQVCKVERHIRTLLRPKSTVMDVNIATALWFASSGSSKGGGDDVDTQASSSQSYSHPRVLLLGMGADEQMGGYGRHRKAYVEGGWDLLRTELTMDQNRLWERNLGRDDRLVCDHGKEARFPFLDAHVVSFLKQLQRDSPQLICDMDLPPGVGDKQILRLVAKRLGLDHASGLVKRAIQFGSRISHVSDTKRFGSRRKAKGETKI